MSLSNKEYMAIQMLIKKTSEKFDIKKTILFGSKARGDDTVDSDIDLLFLVDNHVDLKAQWLLWDIATEVEWQSEVYISCKLFNYEDWESENEDAVFLPFKDNVLKDGEFIEV